MLESKKEKTKFRYFCASHVSKETDLSDIVTFLFSAATSIGQ